MGPVIRLEPELTSRNGASEEEADNHTMTRMLEDGTGRLCKYMLPFFKDSVSFYLLYLLYVMRPLNYVPSRAQKSRSQLHD